MSEVVGKEKSVWEVGRNVVERLTPKYGAGEAREMKNIIFENLKGWTFVDLAIRANEPMSEFMEGKVNRVVERLLNDEPIQYVFGVADFYGMKFAVNEFTLIPRPETAELVDWIVDENHRKDLRVVDFGTGSGCIAISLALNLPFADVVGVDISRGALDVASANAKKLRSTAQFVEYDMLKLNDSAGALCSDCPQLLAEKFDIIVSNPPYIADGERKDMAKNVLEHEPSTALFVPDDNPLKFYDAVLRFAASSLAEGGAVYFEINPLFVAEMKVLSCNIGFTDAEVRRDSFGKLRFMKITR